MSVIARGPRSIGALALLSPQHQDLPFTEPMFGESSQAYLGFCAYRDMSAQVRTINKAAESIQRGLHTCREWAVKFFWNQRAQLYDVDMERRGREIREGVHFKEIEDFQERQKRVSIAMLTRTLHLLDKVGKRIDALKPEQIKPSMIPSYLRAISAVAEAASNAEAQSIAVSDMLAIVTNADSKPARS